MRIIATLILLFSFQTLMSQKIIINDSLEIEFKKTKTLSNAHLHSSVKMKKNKDAVRILVRCDINALFKQEADINAFSLLDVENKFRYRIASYYGYRKTPSLSPGDLGRTHLKKEVLNKKGKQYNFLPPYDESVTDSFETFNFEGYTNYESTMRYYNMVSGEVISVIYFGPSKKPKFRADLQFIVYTNQKKPKLQLYYRKEFVCDIELK